MLLINIDLYNDSIKYEEEIKLIKYYILYTLMCNGGILIKLFRFKISQI